MVNLTAVPIGEDHSSVSAPLPFGSGLYARSSALAPVGPEDHTTHTTPVPEVVPLEVTTGEPEV